jgi:HlyD family secretion protein
MENQKEVATARLATFKTQIDAVKAETNVLRAKLDLYNDQMEKSVIKAPLDGTVLERFANKSELVTPGKLLFTMADLDNMELKAYVSGEQLSQIELDQNATIRIDWEEGSYREYPGKISWISSEAEFTPKIIQTKEERVNLVYSIKLIVKNDGKIKIGMPGEVIF